MDFSVSSSDKILIAAASPDDLAIACGGFLLKYSKQIDLLCVTFEGYQHFSNVYSKIAQIADVNKVFIENSSEVLETQKVKMNDYDIILIPYKDGYKEHEFICNNVIKSLFEKQGFKDSLQLIRYELWTTLKEVNYYEDITEFINKKKELISSYRTGNENYVNGIISNNKFRTYTSYLYNTAEYVEAYFLDDLNACLDKPDIINEATDKEYKNEEIEKFLDKYNAQEKINSLVKRFENKRFIIFGAGDLTRCIFKKYDLSALNIVAIADKRFEQGRLHEFYGLKCIKPNDIPNEEADVILISEHEFVKYYDILTNRILGDAEFEIAPLVKTSLRDYIKTDSDDIICARPFHVLSIVPTGHCITCCPAYIKNFAIGSVFNDSFENVWRSKRAQYLRNALINDDYTTCDMNTCINFEPANKNDISKYYEQDCSTIKMPDTIFMSWDFDCNVACITCRNEIIKNDEKSLKSLQSIEKSVLEACKDAKYFYASGNGDPFGSSHARDIIKKVVEINPRIKFLLHTNGVLCTKRLCDELGITDKIKNITFSIHAACKETYDKIVRYGNFEKVYENLRWISSLKKEGKIEDVTMVFVVHKLNYKDMPDFVRLAEKYDAVASFRYYRQWANNTEYNYDEMAVFDETHPEYAEFSAMMKDSIFDSPHCFLDPNLRFIHNS